SEPVKGVADYERHVGDIVPDRGIGPRHARFHQHLGGRAEESEYEHQSQRLSVTEGFVFRGRRAGRGCAQEEKAPCSSPGYQEFDTIIAVEAKKIDVADEPTVSEAPKPRRSEVSRGVIAEWTVTIILLLFGTTTLVQAFVIPTGSMEDT